MLLALTPTGYILNALFLIVGVFLLVKGADLFVASASSIAKKFKIPSLIIGLTVVAFGTSLPELAVALASSFKGVSGLALGNVVGSNISNIALVLGLAILISPIPIKKTLRKREFPFLIGATILLIVFAFDNLLAGYTGVNNILSRGEALVFIAGIIFFCYLSIVLAKKDEQVGEINTPEEEIKVLSNKKTILFLLLGMSFIVIGAEFITTPAKNIAISIGSSLGVDKELLTNLVGLTVVAIGTSLPELVTSVVASKKGENEIAVGNVLGSNIFNILFICGMSGVITPLTMSADIMTDLVFSLVLTVILFIFTKKGLLKRMHGTILLSIYVLYLTYIIIRLFNPALVIPV